MNLIAAVPDLHDWRDLAGRTLADGDGDPNDEDYDLFCGGPDLFAYPPGADPKQRADGPPQTEGRKAERVGASESISRINAN
jgi:hypothetical protein